MIIPNIINGFDFSLFLFSVVLWEKEGFLSLSLIKRFENGFFTITT